MPLSRARCVECGNPLGDPPAISIRVVCSRCHTNAAVGLTADGQPVDFRVAFSALELLAWFAAARDAFSRGALGVALADCPQCRHPLVVPEDAPIALPCPYCSNAPPDTTCAVLTDQWTEPWARVESPSTSLEYRLVFADEKDTLPGCSRCAFPTPAGELSDLCPRCGAYVWAKKTGGKRVQLGVRVDGTRMNLPYKAIVSVVHGEALLRGDATRAGALGSGSALLGLTGVGCLLAASGVAFFVLGLGVSAYLIFR